MPTNFLPMFWDAFLESLIMVGTAGLFAFAAGIPLAVVLVTTSIGGIYEMPRLNRVLGSVINGFRSTPSSSFWSPSSRSRASSSAHRSGSGPRSCR